MKTLLALLALFPLLSVPPAQAAQPAGQVTYLSGVLSVKRADGSVKMLSVKSDIEEGDVLSTARETYARIKFVDDAEVMMLPGTDLKIASYKFNQAKPESDSVVISMLKGGMRVVTGLIGKRSRDSVSFSTPFATIGIRGSHWGALLCQNDCGNVPTPTGLPPPNGLHLDVVSGAILARNSAGQQLIGSGQFGFVQSQNTAPTIVPQAALQTTGPQQISSGFNNTGIYLSLIDNEEVRALVQAFFDDPRMNLRVKNSVYSQLAGAFNAKSELDAWKAASTALSELSATSRNPATQSRAGAALRDIVNARIAALDAKSKQAQTQGNTTVTTTVMTTNSTTSSTSTIRRTSPSQ